MHNKITPLALMISALCCYAVNIHAATEFSNIGSIVNTRHNLTQRSANGSDMLAGPLSQNAVIGGGAAAMDGYRNSYGEVCVYCHTPHAANTRTELQNAPLWNRTMPVATGYATYDKVGTSSTTAVTDPGANSLTCLSCHDGSIAIDSIINMPGSGNASNDQEYLGGVEYSTNSETFLDSWSSPIDVYGAAAQHARLGPHDGDANAECMSCHNGSAAQDFATFLIGTDLTNDHPVGIGLPTTASGDPISADFNQPTAINTVGANRIAFYDKDGDSNADSNEIRFYDTGDGFEVECASCHDPHGVRRDSNPANRDSPTNYFNNTFLRVSNLDSGVCLTCHIK